MTIHIKERVRVHIRWLIRRDFPEVLEIEAASRYGHWTEEDFLACLRQRNCIGFVAEVKDSVVGFVIYELHKRKFHVLNFAVSPAYRRVGVGSQMVGRLINKLSSPRRDVLTIDVPERNLAAQLFFRSQGFKAETILPREYPGQDAYRFVYRLEGQR